MPIYPNCLFQFLHAAYRNAVYEEKQIAMRNAFIGNLILLQALELAKKPVVDLKAVTVIRPAAKRSNVYDLLFKLAAKNQAAPVKVEKRPVQPNHAQPRVVVPPKNISQAQAPRAPGLQMNAFEKSKLEAISKIFKDAVQLGMRNVPKEVIAQEVNKLGLGKTHAFNLQGQLYAVSNDADSSVVKVARKSFIPFKQGGFGEIFPMIDLDHPSDKANILKLAKDNPVARADVVREQQILNYLHGDQKKLKAGLQKPPHKIVNIGQANGNHKVGYLAARYEMDGADLARKVRASDTFSPDQKGKMIANLISGLETVQKAGVYHGDIKLENTLFGNGDLVLSDFGGARKFSEIFQKSKIPSLPEFLGAHTPNYLSSAIASQLQISIGNAKRRIQNGMGHEQQILNDFQTAAANLLKSNDKFALGLSLFKLWTKKDPLFFRSGAAFDRREQLSHGIEALKKTNLNKASKLSILDLLLAGATPALQRVYAQQRSSLFA